MPGASDQTAQAALSEAGRAEALRRWLVLRPHVEDGVPLTRVAAQRGIPHRTLQRWLARAVGPAELRQLQQMTGEGASVTQAARILKISRSTAYGALKERAISGAG